MFLTDKEFSALRARFEAWKETGYPEIDPGLQPVLENLNTLPGVVTVSSCIGHYRGTPRVKIPFYLYVGVTEAGHPLVLEVFQRMVKRLLEVERIYQENLAIYAKGTQPSHSLMPAKELKLGCNVATTKLSEGEEFTYYRMAITASGGHMATLKENFISELVTIIERVRHSTTINSNNSEQS